MSTADRVATLVERISALEVRVSDLLRDPSVDIETRVRMRELYQQWLQQFHNNVEIMERLSKLMEYVAEREQAPFDDQGSVLPER